MTTDSLFKWRHFLPEIIVLNVRWYCRYPLSYRDMGNTLDFMLSAKRDGKAAARFFRKVLKATHTQTPRVSPSIKRLPIRWQSKP